MGLREEKFFIDSHSEVSEEDMCGPQKEVIGGHETSKVRR